MNLQHRTVEVAAAVLTDNGKVLACQRGYGEWKGYWEFPGGKLQYEIRRA
ncbi:MAG: NUDIX domain-containing protein [Candidatus Cryptobacteroides sp.]